MHFNTSLLLTTIFSAATLSFFIVGAASVSRGWFKDEIDSNGVTLRGRWGTTGCCVNRIVDGAKADDCFQYRHSNTSTDLLSGGRIALVFSILGVVMNGIASMFTGIVGQLTAWRLPHMRSKQDCIAAVCALVGLCCGLIAVCSFYGFMKRTTLPQYQPRPDYAWTLVLLGSLMDILLVCATCIHVIIPDTESPWHERPQMGITKDEDEQLIKEQIGDTDIDEDQSAQASPRTADEEQADLGHSEAERRY